MKWPPGLCENENGIFADTAETPPGGGSMGLAHLDRLAGLNRSLPMTGRVALVHEDLARRFGFVHRLAVAVLDEKRGTVKTYVASGVRSPLVRYEIPLAEAPSLRRVIESGLPRLIQDLSVLGEGKEHTRAIRSGGFASSYTVPVHLDGRPLGAVFFDSKQSGAFPENLLDDLDLYAHLVADMVARERETADVLLAAMRTAGEVVHLRDPETGAHLERMARYSRLVARTLMGPGAHGLEDEFIEDMFLFAPLHDVGKIGISDEILLKPDRLTRTEFDVMKTHTTQGRQMVARILDNFGLEAVHGTEMLLRIPESHHETMDGRGYPYGLAGEEIPLEARIVAVADVFDALVSKRPYKEAWPFEDACEALRSLAGSKLDRECVRALLDRVEDARQISCRFVG